MSFGNFMDIENQIVGNLVGDAVGKPSQ